MCGIFGVVTSSDSQFNPAALQETIDRLFRLSESRGKEASGVALLTDQAVNVIKNPIPARDLIRSKDYRRVFEQAVHTKSGKSQSLGIIGHSRMATNGAREHHVNNQPVIADGMVAIHNGIVVNDAALWKAYPLSNRASDLDSEVILRLIKYFRDQGQGIIEAAQSTFSAIQGATSVGVFFENEDYLLLATNNGSLYVCIPESGENFIFASEEYILKSLLKSSEVQRQVGAARIVQVHPGEGYLVHLKEARPVRFSLKKGAEHSSAGKFLENGNKQRTIVDIFEPPVGMNQSALSFSLETEAAPTVLKPSVPSSFTRSFEERVAEVGELRRCSRCILPETMPFIEFDEEGVCSFCRHYSAIELKGHDALARKVEPYRNQSGKPDCIVSLSGGRDSTYGLHYVVQELGLKPVAYTYDWGMVTDLARRNISRICGQLGIEHILISANIPRKRQNIRKNVSAWLRQPDLGMIPLFMAGDKQYFYYGSRLMRQCGVDAFVLSENLLERTNFKTGFCGIQPTFETSNTYNMSRLKKLRLAGYYMRNYLTNPGYLNSSLLDTFFAFCSYYVIPHNFLSLYQYIPWDENDINQTLIDEYDWEVASDTKSTWRIGDGTASFYNYIYFMASGLTENDTFRSNQIREKMVTREEALTLSQRENRPRWDSMQWYCDTIGLDFQDTIRTINHMPRLYGLQSKLGI